MLEKLSSHMLWKRVAMYSSVCQNRELPSSSQPKLSKGRSAKLSFKPRSCLRAVISSCSCKVMSVPRTAAELYGSLTQSRQSVADKENKMTTSALEFSNVVQHCWFLAISVWVATCQGWYFPRVVATCWWIHFLIRICEQFLISALHSVQKLKYLPCMPVLHTTHHLQAALRHRISH